MPEQRKSSAKKPQTVNLEAIGLEMGNKPPQALDFEEAVLGALLVDPDCAEEAMEELTPACFYDPKHRMIFEAMVSLTNAHAPLDLLSVTQELQAQGNLENVGGPVVLASLSQKIAAAAHTEYHIRILKQKCIQRDLISASYDILKNAYDESVNVDDLIDMSQSKVLEAVQNNVKRDVQEIGSVIRTALDDIERMQAEGGGYSGVPSGYSSIDDITMGWQKSDLIILAARPSVGKTAFALNIARNAAIDAGVPVAFFSLEMPSIQLAKRLMTSETELPAEKIKGGSRLSEAEWAQLNSKLRALSKAPIYVDDTPSLPIMEFRAKARRLVRTKQVGLIVVDYLQLMQGPADLRGMREQEVAAISRTLKATAKELNVPIIALSQLSRQAVQRTGGTGRPQLSDLRESGSIEQDADMVLFVHRPDSVGLSEHSEDKEKTFIIIAKHRNGQTGEIEMRFKSDLVKFVEVNDTLSAAPIPIGSAMNDDYAGPSGGYPGVPYDPFTRMP